MTTIMARAAVFMEHCDERVWTTVTKCLATARSLLVTSALARTPGVAFHGEKDEEAFWQAVESEQEPVLTKQAGTGCQAAPWQHDTQATDVFLMAREVH